jgi:hypothetical protein
MNETMHDLLLRIAAGMLIAAGVIAVLLGYLGIRDQSEVVLQLPYVVSGGLGGLALILLGAAVMIYGQIRQQAQRNAEVVDSLEEWKEAALAEVRAFLEDATIEVDLAEALQPPSNGSSRPRKTRVNR